MEIGIVHAFLTASILNKVIFGFLLITSVSSWAIILQKMSDLKKYKISSKMVEEIIRKKNESLSTLLGVLSHNRKDGYSKIIGSLLLLKPSRNKGDEQISNIVYNSSLNQNLGFLAIVASSAPFIGLLGTVLGVINAFEQIGVRGSVSLTVIAPGIAEALYATALGLFVAVPASIMYNFVSIALENYERELTFIFTYLYKEDKNKFN